MTFEKRGFSMTKVLAKKLGEFVPSLSSLRNADNPSAENPRPRLGSLTKNVR